MKTILKYFTVIILIFFIFGNLYSMEKLPDLMNSRWMVIGPFENPEVNGICQNFNKDFLSDFGGEKKIQPEIKQVINKLKWQYFEIKSDYLNFIDLYGGKNYSIAYAYQEFNIKSDQKAVLKVGSDDGIKIWLNNEEILSHHIHRSINPDDELLVVNLKAGINKILVKVDQGTGEWGFVLGLRSLKDEIAEFNKDEISGLKINLNENIITGNNINGYVITKPSHYINEKVKVILYDINNKKLKEINTEIGQKFIFDIKGLKSNPYYIKSYGAGKLSQFQSDQEIVIVGDYNKILNKYITLANAISMIRKYPKTKFDIRATVLFLRSQLKGNINSSLTTPERNLIAINTINEIYKYIKNPDLKLTGINQRAYLSSIDGSYQPYTIYTPSTYNKARKYSLLICLHGYSDNDYNAAKKVAECKPDDFIIACPFGRGSVGFFGLGEQDVLDVIDTVTKNYNIDNDKIYITGWSMGGLGTWRFGQIYADKFAAMAAFCGWTWEQYLDNLINLPVLIVHGTEDTTIPINLDKNAANKLESFGYDVNFDIVQGAGHNVWDVWIKNSGPNKLLEYLRKYKRNPYPKNINIHTKYIRYGKQYWAKIMDFINPGNAGLLKIKIADERHINIKTENIKSFKINLDHPDLAKNGRIILNINGDNVLSDAGKKEAVISFSEKYKQYKSIKNYNDPPVSRDGGGLVDLFLKKLYIVYGTKKKSSTKKWKNFADILSNLNVSEQNRYGTQIGQYKIISDKELLKLIESQNDKIKDSNFLLLGSDKENMVLEKIIPDLPIKFHGDEFEISNEKYKNKGIIFVHPNPVNKKNLVGIISLPFKDKHVIKIGQNLNQYLRMFNISADITGFIYPDAVIFKSYNKVSAIGYYNYNWKELKIAKKN